MKLRTVALFGAGYVLGTRAGRERYGQIVAAAQNASKRLEDTSGGPGAVGAALDSVVGRLDQFRTRIQNYSTDQ